MKITLISLSEDIVALGIRSLSAYLKANGHQVRLIFLRGHTGKSNYLYQYPQPVLDGVIKLCRGSDLIGISVYTNYFDRVVQLTKELKLKLSVPIIWGNIHPTVRPEESLAHVDIVCLGEGEDALLELANKLDQGKNIYHIKNLWFKKDGRIIKNEVRPLIKDLDSLPICDFDLDDDYALDAGKFRRVNFATFKEFSSPCFDKNYELKISFGILASRGCPHACAYCGNNARKKMYSGQPYLRFRSPENVVEELEIRKKRYPFIKMITFIDDVFVAQSNDQIKKFCKLYKKKIDLPFHCFASPTALNEEKLRLLVEAGLEHIGIGIQSGSDRMQSFYQRYINSDRVLQVAKIVKKQIGKIAPPCYDIIVDNPYEKNDDKLATLRLLTKIPSPYRLSLFSLVFYPGTELNVLAKKDGLLQDEVGEVARKSWVTAEYNGYNFLLHLLSFNGNFKKVVGFFSKKKIFLIINRKELNLFWRLMWHLTTLCFLIDQGFKALIKGDLPKKIGWLFSTRG